MEYEAEQLSRMINPAFYPLLWNKDRYLILWGGGDSGKSRFAGTKLMLRALQAWADRRAFKFVIFRKTQPAVRDSAFALMKGEVERWNLQDFAKITKSPMRITLPYGEFIFTGIDDPMKIKSIENVTGVWCEEAPELKTEDFRQIDLRLRGETGDYKQIISSFNPVDETSWIKSEFFDDRENVTDVTPERWPKYMQRKRIDTIYRGQTVSTYITFMHSTYLDNIFHAPEDAAILEGLKYKDEQYYKVYCLGLWGVKRGLIFTNWEITKVWPKTPQEDDTDEDLETRIDTKGFGLDFGYSSNPVALIEIAFVGDTLYLKERIYERGLTNQQLGAKMTPICTEEYSNDLIVADNAEPKSIAEIRAMSFNVIPCTKGKDSVNYGIQRMQQYKIRIWHESTNLIKEFENYKWAEDPTKTDSEGKPLSLGHPVDFMNHGIDGVRYYVTKIKGVVKIGLNIISEDKKEARKEIISKPGYDPMEDDALWKSEDD